MDSRLLNICQLNCQRAYSVMGELGQYMCENGVSVALLQEPYVVNGKVCGLPTNFRVVQSRPRENGVGSAIVIGDVTMDLLEVEECTDEWGVCVWSKCALGEIFLTSVYCRHGEDIEPYTRYLDRVRLMSASKHLLIGMDANTLSPLWFSKRIPRGRRGEARSVAMEEWIVGAEMEVLNEPSEWFTFSGPRGESDIDVTLVNNVDGALDFKWRIEPDGANSDHNMILLEVSAGVRTAPDTVTFKRWCTKRVNWQAYKLSVRENAIPYDSFCNMNIDEKVEAITKWITDANSTHMREYRRKNEVAVKWWTQELADMRQHARHLRKVYQRARRHRVNERGTWLHYANHQKTYKDAIRKAKEVHWRSFVSVQGNENVWGPVYRICRGRKRSAAIHSMKVGQTVTRNWEDSATLLLNAFFPEAATNSVEHVETVGNHRVIEDAEITEALYRTRVRRAPGLDGISGEMLRAAWSSIPEYFGSLLNQCVSEGYFPKDWKKADVVVLLKSPDKVKTEPASYRPICLLPVMGKVLERILVNRMSERLLEEEIAGSQFGFTPGKSTEDAWMRATAIVDSSGMKYVLGLFVDFTSAFDRLEWPRILEKLREIGSEEWRLWRSYFQDRRACVRSETGIVWKDVVRGCPQGSIAGPAMWNMMVNDLLVVLSRIDCKVVAYADDLLIIVEGMSRAELERKGTDCMRYVSAWGEYVGVGVSMTKSECMLLKGRLSLSRPPNIRVMSSGMRYATTIKYLGVHMGERMSFKCHLEHLREKVLKVVNAMRRVLRKEWGLNKAAIQLLHKALFVPVMSYGACVWYGILQYEYARKMLLSTQRLVLYASLNVCRTVSTDAMQVLSGELPWDLEIISKGNLGRMKRGLPLAGVGPDMTGVAHLANAKEAKTWMAERMYAEWQKRWDDSPKGRQTFNYIRDVTFAKSQAFSPSLQLGYLLTGHGSLNSFLMERGLSNTAECLCGASRETVKHIMVECVIYHDLRQSHSPSIVVREDGTTDFGEALKTRERYEALEAFARAVFERRTELLATT